jgi:hypothetical protein
MNTHLFNEEIILLIETLRQTVLQEVYIVLTAISTVYIRKITE